MPKEPGRIRHKLGMGVCQYPKGCASIQGGCVWINPLYIPLSYIKTLKPNLANILDRYLYQSLGLYFRPYNTFFR